MIDEGLTDISPRLRWRCVVNEQEENNQDAYAACSIVAIHEEHCYNTKNCTGCCGPPVEIVK